MTVGTLLPNDGRDFERSFGLEEEEEPGLRGDGEKVDLSRIEPGTSTRCRSLVVRCTLSGS